jgi:membrane fusion protein
VRRPLFRPDAERRARLFGEVVIAMPVSHATLTAVMVGIFVSTVVFLSIGSYARKESVNGLLVPSGGIARVYAPEGGVCAALAVGEGDQVRDGDLLFRADRLRALETGEEAGERTLAILREERAAVDSALEQQAQYYSLEDQRLRNRLVALAEEESAARREAALLAERLTIMQRRADREQSLEERGIVAPAERDSTQGTLLQMQQEATAAEARRTRLARERSDAKFQLEALPAQRAEVMRRLQGEAASLEQRLLDVANRRSYEVRAPVSGTVTAVAAVVGSELDPRAPVLSILPENSGLEAQLYVPSRAIGFLEPGQSVRLVYEAFPYQQFGTYPGVVSEVARGPTAPSTLPPEIPDREPGYRVRVDLGSQGVEAYGRSYALQPGMALRAEIVLQHRTLLEWLLDPLIAAAGSLLP